MRPARLRLVAVLIASLVVAELATVAVRASRGGKVATTAPSRRSTTTASSSSTTASTVPTAAASAGAPATAAPPIPDAQARELDQIKGQVASLRHLDWLEPLDVAVVGDADFVKQLNAVEARDNRPDRQAGDGETDKLLHLI